MDRLVECVPNFSEGRNEETLRALVAVLAAVPQVVLLDEQRDHDHHRSVLTFVGTPEAVLEAAVALARVAAEWIDLRQHHGEHPRVGAMDVVPFVPIRGVTMEDCVELARRAGERIGTELGIPVFLYERAASRPERQRLEQIRRGGLGGLETRMREAAWRPDFGPPRLHPSAGAIVIGARPILMAFNVNLHTTDLGMAKAIAKKIRQSGGGLPAVKAIGVKLASRGLVQVSMNLTNQEETPLHVAFEAVCQEAARHHVRIAGSEVIGLIPQGALLGAAERFLKLERFDRSQVLEARLESALAGMSKGQTVAPGNLGPAASSLHAFCEAVSAAHPTPAGGSVAALVGALAASLGLMACRIGPPATARPSIDSGTIDSQNALQAIEQRLIALRQQLEELVQADAQAYEQFIEARRLPKTDPQRETEMAQRLHRATHVSLEIADLACEVATLLRPLPAQTKPSVRADLQVGLMMALAAAEAGVHNAEENEKLQIKHIVAFALEGKIKALKERLEDLRKL
ncbi:MAG: glutamate formimidoyltransferase [Nitrospirota bacterium]|nr:glutamate formimidoyltransferase [Nitrospirota bacterium]